MLIPERLLHVSPVIGAEVEREHLQQGAEDPIGS
jgi:hypothetical protein